MKTVWPLALTLSTIVAAAPAWAQTPPSPTEAPPPPRAPKDVVVTAKRPPAKCADKDRACLTVVAEELWKRYPKEIDRYCYKQEWAARRNRQNKEDFFGMNPGSALPDTQGSYAFDDELPPGLKFVCDYKPPKPAATPAPSR